MSIIVLLSTIHFFSFFELSFINLKLIYNILDLKGDHYYLPFQETNKSINQ